MHSLNRGACDHIVVLILRYLGSHPLILYILLILYQILAKLSLVSIILE